MPEMAAPCSCLPTDMGSHMNDVEKLSDIIVKKVFTGAAGLPGGAHAMAAMAMQKVLLGAAIVAAALSPL